MAAEIQQLIEKTVSVITADGRHLVGTLKGYDQKINIVLCNCHEREYSTEDGVGVHQQPLGAQIVQGSNICIIGELDAVLDAKLDLDNLQGERIPPVTH